jgi:hypothetical protein
VDSAFEIAAVLTKLIDAWSQNKLLSLVPDRMACEIYSSERQIHELVLALDDSPAPEPFVPGAAKVPASLRSEISKRMHACEQKAFVSGRQALSGHSPD